MDEMLREPDGQAAFLAIKRRAKGQGDEDEEARRGGDRMRGSEI